MDATGNPNLACIAVDNVANANNYIFNGWFKDSTASFNTTCATVCLVAIPDANFKAKLLANTAINTNGDGQIQCSEAIAFTGTMNVSSSNIADLTGIGLLQEKRKQQLHKIIERNNICFDATTGLN